MVCYKISDFNIIEQRGQFISSNKKSINVKNKTATKNDIRAVVNLNSEMYMQRIK